MAISKITGLPVKPAYHGSPFLFDDIDLTKGGFLKDFGQGFYLSDDPKHAYLAGRKKAIVMGYSKVYLYSYELPVTWPDYINKHVFRGANAEWLDFIVRNRKEMPVKYYDVIYGPTADAITTTIIDRYIAGDYREKGMSKEDEINKVLLELKINKYARQVCIRSNEAKVLLNRVDMEVIDI